MATPANIGDFANIGRINSIFILDGYKYSSGGHFNKDGIQIIQMGCYNRTRKEWDDDFWNNTNEFPDDGSEESKARLRTYKTICFFLDSIERS